MTLIPKNKTEFLDKSLEDQLYMIYEEAAKARIHAERNGGSLLLNRVLLIVGFAGTMICISQCNKRQIAEPTPIYEMTMPNADDVHPAEKSVYRFI